MPTRRAAVLGCLPFAALAHAQNGVWPEWQGTYAGALRFYRSIPLQDIYPPPAKPWVDLDDINPFGLFFDIRIEDGLPSTWLRIDGGPMQTADAGETLRFSVPINGVAALAGAQAKPEPRTATLTVRPDSLGTEALFRFADGTFWRRHFNARFTPAGADVIVWVFDASGTRARTWRGSTTKRL